jgi:hypothetical protein
MTITLDIRPETESTFERHKPPLTRRSWSIIAPPFIPSIAV